MNLKLMDGDFKLSNIKMKELNFGEEGSKRGPTGPKTFFYLAKFPKFLKDLPEGVLLDFELYSTKGRRIPSVFIRTGLADPVVYVFDIVFFEGKFIGDKSLKERKEILSKIKLNPPFHLLEYKLLKNWEKL